MDVILGNQGLSYIAQVIFAYLDNFSLCQSRSVCKLWLFFIDSGLLLQRRKLQHEIEYHSGHEWFDQEWLEMAENGVKSSNWDEIQYLISALKGEIL